MDPVLALALALVLVLGVLLAVALIAPRRRSPLAVGRPVIVVTPRPDDQSLHGVVLKNLGAGGVILTAAHYLPAEGDPVPVGTVHVPAYAFAQVDVAPVEIRSSAQAGATPRPTIPLPDTRRPERLRVADPVAPPRDPTKISA